MEIVLITAFGVGGATVIGALIGLIFKNVDHKFSDIILSFAAGVMLSASFVGLIIPSLELGNKYSVLITLVGIFTGAIFVDLIDKFVPHLHKLTGSGYEEKGTAQEKSINRILLFVFAIAIHNFPEGIAAGVGFGTGNITDALKIAGGIALQNIPEGMVIISPMLSIGLSYSRALIIATITGVIEVVGTFIGLFAVNLSNDILPFALAFAGGTMLYVVSDEMIPETHSHGSEKGATFSLLMGLCLMLVIDKFLG